MSSVVFSETFDSSIGSFSAGTGISWVSAQGLRLITANSVGARSNHLGTVFTPTSSIVEWAFTLRGNPTYLYSGTSHSGVVFNWNGEALSTSTTDRLQKPYLYHNVPGLVANVGTAHSDVFWISQAYPNAAVQPSNAPVYIVGRGNTTLWVSSEPVNTLKRYFHFTVDLSTSTYRIYLSTTPRPSPTAYTTSGSLSLSGGPSIPVTTLSTGMVLNGWYNSASPAREVYLDDVYIYDGGEPIPLASVSTWGGSSWLPGSQWNGSSWVDISGLTTRWNGSSWESV